MESISLYAFRYLSLLRFHLFIYLFGAIFITKAMGAMRYDNARKRIQKMVAINFKFDISHFKVYNP